MTREAIIDAVGELDCPDYDRPGIVRKVFDRGIKTFSILIWMEKAKAIIDFIEHDLLDSRLPVEESLVVQVAPTFGKHFAQEIQWQFLPYVFEPDMYDYHLSIRSEYIFPFTAEAFIGDGGYGEVVKVTMPFSQQRFFASEVSPECTWVT
jgi:hypothetical protein